MSQNFSLPIPLRKKSLNIHPLVVCQVLADVKNSCTAPKHHSHPRLVASFLRQADVRAKIGSRKLQGPRGPALSSLRACRITARKLLNKRNILTYGGQLTVPRAPIQ